MLPSNYCTGKLKDIINTFYLDQEITKEEQVTWQYLQPAPSYGDLAGGSTRSLEWPAVPGKGTLVVPALHRLMD